MSSGDFLPPVDSIVEVGTINLVPRYCYKEWMIVAEAEVVVPGKSNGKGTVLAGKIPIEEISPYQDFDPIRRDRSWEVRLRMCRVLLFDSDRRFLVIDHDNAKRKVVLSLKQVVLRERTVPRTDHKPTYVAQGFRDLQNLHFHLLKHPLRLGGGVTDWPSLLGARYWREGILRRLQVAGCPVAREYDGETQVLGGTNPCSPCSMAQKMRCFPVLQAVRKPYEQQAMACISEASDKMNPRHYHYTEEIAGKKKSILIFMDGNCRRLVAKRSGDQTYFTTATFFQPEDCDHGAPDDRLKYLAERRKRIDPIVGSHGYSDTKICTPISWGYRQ